MTGDIMRHRDGPLYVPWWPTATSGYFRGRSGTDFLDKLHEDDLVTQVKTAIVEELPSGSPRDDVIAKSVFMSSRTLNRRLSAVGTTYSQLLDAVWWELAEQYITDPSLSLSEISFLLGFAELSSFSRAFRRWTGASPSAARNTAAA